MQMLTLVPLHPGKPGGPGGPCTPGKPCGTIVHVYMKRKVILSSRVDGEDTETHRKTMGPSKSFFTFRSLE